MNIVLLDEQPFLPSLLAPTLWLDAADTATITESSGSVSQWNDKSGNGNNVTQSTGSAQPTTGSNTLNGKNVVTFDGSDTLTLPSPLFTIPNGNSTVFSVSRQANVDAIDFIIGMDEGGADRYVLRYDVGQASVSFRSRNNNVGSVTTSTDNRDYNVIVAYRNGTEEGIAVNGGTFTTSSSATSEDGIDGGNIGSQAGTQFYLTGDIAEILLFNRSLASNERIVVATYLKNKWGISWA